MSDVKQRIDELLAALKTERDELALRMHLGKAEAKDEWERLEKRLAELRQQAAPYTAVAGDTAKGVAEELRKGYERVRQMMRET